VLILLGFQANHHLENKKNENMMDIATKFNQIEILKLLRSWDLIKKETRKIDFKNLWSGFLKNYEAVISRERSAELSMSDYAMAQRIRILERSKIDYIPIDDNLLRMNHNDNINGVIVCKPWEAGWIEYAKGIEREKQIEIDNQNEIQKVLDMRGEDDYLQSDNIIGIDSDNNITKNNKSNYSNYAIHSNVYNTKNELISIMTKKSYCDIKLYTEKNSTLPQEIMQNKLNNNQQDTNMTSFSNDNDSRNHKIKQELNKRRKQVAQAILLDAQHLDTTTKSSLSSVLLHPVRIEEKNQHQKEEILRLKDNVYNHVALQQNRIITDVAVRSVQKDTYKRSPMVLIDNKRKQFIESNLLPPLSNVSVINKIANEKKDIDDPSLLEENSTGDIDNDSINTDTILDDKLNKSVLNRNMMLKKNIIVYGKGRLLSSYNSSLPLDDPWEYINGMYKPIEFDRTA
jgi:hypothetical protein